MSELKKQIIEVKKSKEKEISVREMIINNNYGEREWCFNLMCNWQELNEQIAHLKDQLQELKAKTGLEEKFIKKSTKVSDIGVSIIINHFYNICYWARLQ